MNSKIHRNILLVEDEEHLAFNLKLNLEAEGYTVHHVVTGKEAIDELQGDHQYSLILLDIMIPEPDGFAVAKWIRSRDLRTAIIMLTAKAADTDRLRGLQLGADDYISKPFHLQELLLKVRRCIEREKVFKNIDDMAESHVVSCGAISLDTENLVLTTPKGTFDVTVLESDLLLEFIKHYDRVLSRHHLLRNVWKASETIESRTIDNFIMRLRRYLEEDSGQPRYLKSIRGRGYKLTGLKNSKQES